MSLALRSCSVVLALACMLPTRALAAPPTGDGIVRAELELDTSKLGEDGEVVAEQLRVRGDALLRNREVLPARSAADPRIVVAIEPLGEGGPGYRCRWGVYQGQQVVSGSEGVSLCKLCTESELVDHVQAAIERAVPQVPAQTSTAPTPTPGTTTPPERQAAGSRALGPMGKAGIGVGVVGVAALVTGIALTAVDPKRNETELGHEVGPTRPAGIALLVVGGAALVTGIALLAVDRRRARKSARTAFAPAPLRSGAGFVFVGRF